jgi:DNA-binding response OmpR family regulator
MIFLRQLIVKNNNLNYYMKNTTKTILIVEDEASLSQALVEKFKSEGFSILEASNGLDGLEKAIEHHPDLILLDIIMPKMDGITMMKKLRVDRWGEKVPVIVLTNLTDAAKADQALKQGAYDFLIKTDWKLEDVVKKVKQKLKLK